jgi:hypothetical protein
MQNPELELASDLARIRAIYKLIPLPSPMNVLEVVAPGKTAVLTESGVFEQVGLVLSRVEKLAYKYVESVEISRYPAEALFDLKHAGISVQLIIMHGTYSGLKASIENVSAGPGGDNIVAAFSDILSTGGILAGCFENRRSIRRVLKFNPGNSSRHTHCLSLRGIRKHLAGNHFSKPRLFALYPNMYSPLSLAEVNDKPSIRYSLDQTHYLRNWLGRGNFYLRMLFSAFGIALNFDDEYFFFAQRE